MKKIILTAVLVLGMNASAEKVVNEFGSFTLTNTPLSTVIKKDGKFVYISGQEEQALFLCLSLGYTHLFSYRTMPFTEADGEYYHKNSIAILHPNGKADVSFVSDTSQWEVLTSVTCQISLEGGRTLKVKK